MCAMWFSYRTIFSSPGEEPSLCCILLTMLSHQYLQDYCHVMSVVGKSTCSGFTTGLYISYHGGNAVRYIKQKGYFMKNGRRSGYFDTKYMKVLRIEQILHNFKDQKIANFFYLEQVDFRVTLVMYVNKNKQSWHQCTLPIPSSVNCLLSDLRVTIECPLSGRSLNGNLMVTRCQLKVTRQTFIGHLKASWWDGIGGLARNAGIFLDAYKNRFLIYILGTHR